MKKRSLMSLMVLMALIVAIISACSSKNNNDAQSSSPSSSSPSSSAPASSAASGEKVEIQFWYGWGGPEGEVMEKIIKKFNDSQDHIVVKGTVEGDYSKQLTAITAGNPPDVASNFGNASVPNGENGANTPLDDYMAKSGLTAEQFVPGAIKQQQYNGKTYALPVAMHFSMLFYNKDLLAQAGYDKPPETVQQLFEYFDKLSKFDSNGAIKVLGLGAPTLPVYDYAYLFGGKFVDVDKNEITPQDPGFIQAMKQSAALYKKAGGADKVNAFKVGDWLSANDPFFTGKYAMTFGGEWTGTFIKKFAPNLNYGIAPLPYDENHPEMKGAASVDTSTFYIPKGAKHPDEAWEFINWFMKPENIAEFDAGIGNLTPVIAAIDSPLFNDAAGFKEFLDASKNPNLQSFPASPYMGTYTNEIGVAFNDVLLGKTSAEQAAKQVADKMAPEVAKYKK
ncbi:ABC transporter substrate-binding protein [Cohnella pontilimi]|uniref:ABC transporter substrate-binding protein n=1 Tax=Cohnella pontilimi TaxID=2564100 RepID=A0A4U0FHS2_9BACL|nr:ABC transporter substrate-binding protein [Cohnella pontilimi]TJY44535.1 ABC transporter substrate-binding protein [Cohnella pontilimi]